MAGNNIEQELEQIRTGKYGSDIRMAIHDGIDKLNKAIETWEERTDGVYIGNATFREPTESERISLYDPNKTESEIEQMRYEFWNSMEGSFLPTGYYADYAFILQDEFGEIIPETGFSVTDERDPNSLRVLINALPNGCGVFNVYNSAGDAHVGVGRLQAENNQWYVGYKTQYGIMIIIRDTTDPQFPMNSGVLIIGKTNNGDICWVGKEANPEILHGSAINAYVSAERDSYVKTVQDPVELSFMPDSAVEEVYVKTFYTRAPSDWPFDYYSKSGDTYTEVPFGTEIPPGGSVPYDWPTEYYKKEGSHYIPVGLEEEFDPTMTYYKRTPYASGTYYKLTFTHPNVVDGRVNETILCPIATHTESGRISYMHGIYAMPWSQFRGSDGIFTMNGHEYVTNGYYALQIT